MSYLHSLIFSEAAAYKQMATLPSKNQFWQPNEARKPNQGKRMRFDQLGTRESPATIRSKNTERKPSRTVPGAVL